jgi:predicted ATP-dependent serine protease
MLLQIAEVLAGENGETCYFSVEMSPEELALFAIRIGMKRERIRVLRGMGDLVESSILDTLAEGNTSGRNVKCLIIDSFTAVVGDNRQAADELGKLLKRIAVKLRIPVIAICQINKEEQFAGPEFVQHAVDTILALRYNLMTGERELFTIKNRHGPAHVSVFFDMCESGLVVKEKSEDDEDDIDDGDED